MHKPAIVNSLNQQPTYKPSSDVIATLETNGDHMSKNSLPQTESFVNSNSTVAKRISYNGAINGDAPAKTGVKAMIEKAGGKVVTAKTQESATQATDIAKADTQADSTLAYRFQPMSLTELLSQPPKEWLFDNFIGRGDMVMIYGEPGSGKTFTIIDMIFAGCLGRPFAMKFHPDRQLNIAYCAGEGVGGLPARFDAASAHYGTSNLPNFTFFNTVPQLHYESGNNNEIDSIECFVSEWKQRQDDGTAKPLDILIIDTMHSATVDADENSAKDMGRVLKMCKFATKVLGCAVVLVHHSNRAGTGERGSSSLRGAMDTMIATKPVTGKFSMSCEKLKDGEKWEDITYDLVSSGEKGSVRVWWDEVKDTPADKSYRTTLIEFFTKYPGKAFTLKSVAEATGLKDTNLRNLLPKLCEVGEIKRKLKDENKEQSSANPWTYYI